MVRFVLLLLVACQAGGCVVAAVADRLRSRSVPAAYEPAKEAPLLVIVDPNTDNQVSFDTADRLALRIEQNLKAHQVAPIVSTSELLQLRTSMPYTKYMDLSAAERGKAVGAKQVLVVRLQQYEVSSVISGGSATNAVAAVKVVDVASGKTAWPTEFGEQRITHAAPVQSTGDPVDSLAVRISSLFHDVEGK